MRGWYDSFEMFMVGWLCGITTIAVIGWYYDDPVTEAAATAPV